MSADNNVVSLFPQEERDFLCRGCGRAHRAVVLPFGRCTHCGSEVDDVSALPEALDPVQEALRDAMELEVGGEAFYRSGAKRTDDQEIKALFERLADMEGQHIRRLFWRHRRRPDGQLGPVSLARLVVYGSSDIGGEDAESLLDLAIQLEEMAESFLMERRERFRVDSKAWTLYTEMAEEEREHADLLRCELTSRKRKQQK